MPSVGSSLAIVTAAASTCLVRDLRSVLVTCFRSLFALWVVSQLFTKSTPLESECLEERIEILPMMETTVEQVTVETVEKMTLPWRKFIWGLADQEGALPEMIFMMMHVCWMVWRLCCRRQRSEDERSPIDAIRRRANSSPEDVWWWIFMTTRVGTILDCSCGQSMRLLGSFSLLTVTNMRRDSQDASAPFGGSEIPEVGSVEFNRGWTLNELSELVREGRNLALCARTPMGLTHDRDSTMMCDLSGRLSCDHGWTCQTSDCSKIACVAGCSCESSCTITRLDYSRWHLFSDKKTTSANASWTVGLSRFCVWTCLGEYGNWPNWSMEVWFCCCTARRCLGEGSTKFGVLIRRRLCRRAKDTFERPVYVWEQGCWRHVAFTWWFREYSWWDLSCGPRRESWQDQSAEPLVPFSLRLTKTTLLSDNLQMICGPSGLNMMPMVTDRKPGKISPVRQLLRSPRIGLLMMVGLPCCTWSNISKTRWWRIELVGKLVARKGCERTWTNLDWNEMPHHLSSLEWNVRPAQLPVFGFNGNCVGLLRLLKPVLVRKANHVAPEFITTKGGQVPWTVLTQICELPLQRKPVRSWTLKTSQEWFVLGGKVAQPQVLGMVLTEKEHLPPREWAARDGGLEAWRQRHNDCKPGQETRGRPLAESSPWKMATVLCWIPSFRYPWYMSWDPVAGATAGARTVAWQKTRGWCQCPDLESPLVLWVKSTVCVWFGAYTETRSGDSAGQRVGRSTTPDVRDPRTVSAFSEAAARPWRVWHTWWWTQPGQFSFCVKNPNANDHCGISPRWDSCDG